MELFARISKFMLALILAIASVLVALVMMLVVAINVVDWSKHKDVVIALVERFTDWKVEQLGDIEIDFYMPTEVRIANVALKQQAEVSSLASVSAEHLEVNFNPLSVLFNDRIMIHHLHASGARVVTHEPPQEPPADTGPFSIPHIDSGRIRNSEFVFWVDGMKEDLNLDLAALDIDSPGEGDDLSIDGRGQLEGLPVNIAGRIGDLSKLGESGVLPFDLQGAVAGDEISVQGEVASVENVTGQAKVSMRGDDLSQLAERVGVDLDIPAYQISFSLSSTKEQVDFANIEAQLGESVVRGDASLQMSGPKPYLRADLSSPLLRQQDLAGLIPKDSAEDGSRQSGSSSGPPNLEFLDTLNADVSLKLAEYQGEQLGPLSGLNLDAALKDGRLNVEGGIAIVGEAFNVDAQLGPSQEAAEQTRIPFRIALSMAGDTLVGEGQITAGAQSFTYTAQVRGEGDNLSGVAQSFGVNLDNVPGYQVQMAVDGSTEQVQLENIQASVGESSLRGNMSVQLNETTPILRADLVSPLLREQDIASLIPEDRADDGASETQAGGAPPSQSAADAEPPVDLLALDFLKGFKADVSYRIVEYQGERLAIDSAQVEGTVEDGRLALTGRADAGNLEFKLDSILGPQQLSMAGPQQQGTGEPVLPFSLDLAAAGDTLSADGRIARTNGRLGLQAEASAEGNSVVSIAEVFGINLSDVPPYKVQMAVAASPQRVVIEDIQATLGYSYVYGDMSLQLDRPTPYLRADLGSSLLREQDLAGLVPAGSESAEANDSQVPQLDFLNAFDADLSFAAAELQGEQLGELSRGNLTASLQDGALSVESRIAVEGLDINLAGKLGPEQGEADPEAQSITLPFSLELTAAEDRLKSAGQLTLGPDSLDFQTQTNAQGNSLDRIAQLFDMPLEEPPPYTFSITMNKSAGEIAVPALRLTLGESFLQGKGTLQMDRPQPYLYADVQMPLLRHNDIGALMPPDEEAASENVFSREPFNLDALRQLDGRVQLALERYEGPQGAVLINDLTVQGQLQQGVLDLPHIRMSLAGGELDGRIRLDSREEEPALRLVLSAERIELDQLVAPFFDMAEANMEARGSMGANLEISGAGRSPHEMAADLGGEFSWAIYDGAVPAVVIEGLGLDILEGAVSWFGETVTTGVNCGVGQFVITQGEIHTETFLLSTVDSIVVGDGRIDLAEESVDLKLDTRARDFSIFAADSPVQIVGPLNNVNVTAMSRELAARAGVAVLLGLINPALAIVPFTELGEEDGGQCLALRQEMEQIRAESQ